MEQFKLVGLLFVGIDEEPRLAYCDDLPDFSIDAIIPAARKAWSSLKLTLLRPLATLPNRPASSVRSRDVICSWKSDTWLGHGPPLG
jgi:hypothetical protein